MKKASKKTCASFESPCVRSMTTTVPSLRQRADPHICSLNVSHYSNPLHSTDQHITVRDGRRQLGTTLLRTITDGVEGSPDWEPRASLSHQLCRTLSVLITPIWQDKQCENVRTDTGAYKGPWPFSSLLPAHVTSIIHSFFLFLSST